MIAVLACQNDLKKAGGFEIIEHVLGSMMRTFTRVHYFILPRNFPVRMDTVC